MANDLTKNPLVVDTAGASVLLSKGLWVTAIEWHSPDATEADEVAVQDKNSVQRWGSLAAGANTKEETKFVEDGGQGRFFDGLRVPTLDSGILYIHFTINYN